jgi:hypothetical protein
VVLQSRLLLPVQIGIILDRVPEDLLQKKATVLEELQIKGLLIFGM